MVRDDTGKTVAGAVVAAVRTVPVGGGSSAKTGFALSDGQGRFSISGLVPASYRICAEVSGQPLLDPCKWTTRPPVWNLSGGQSASVSVVLKTGIWIQTRVNDPAQKAVQYENLNGSAAYSLNVNALTGLALPFAQISTDSAGRNFRIAAPRGSSVPVSFNLNLSGVTAQALNGLVTALGPAPTSVTTGQFDQYLNFTIK